MSNRLSPKLDWAPSEISHQLEQSDPNPVECDCKDLDFRNKDADWMMCSICKRIWIRKWRLR